MVLNGTFSVLFRVVRVEYLYFFLHNRLIEIFWDFIDSCSLYLLLSTLFGGYDLYIIALISEPEPERAAEAGRAVVASFLKSAKTHPTLTNMDSS